MLLSEQTQSSHLHLGDLKEVWEITQPTKKKNNKKLRHGVSIEPIPQDDAAK